MFDLLLLLSRFLIPFGCIYSLSCTRRIMHQSPCYLSLRTLILTASLTTLAATKLVQYHSSFQNYKNFVFSTNRRPALTSLKEKYPQESSSLTKDLGHICLICRFFYFVMQAKSLPEQFPSPFSVLQKQVLQIISFSTKRTPTWTSLQYLYPQKPSNLTTYLSYIIYFLLDTL